MWISACNFLAILKLILEIYFAKETTVDPDCSCTGLEVLPKMRNGQTFRIEVGSCKFEINSSVCCPVGLIYQYCVNDPSQICVPIMNFNVTESTTQSKTVNQERDTAGSKELDILLNQQNIIKSVVVANSVGFLVIIIMMGALIIVFWFYFKMLFRKLKKSRTSTLEDIHEPLSLREQDDEDMSF